MSMREVSAHAFTASKQHRGMALVLGLGLFNYLPLVEPIKVVDVICVGAVIAFSNRLWKDSALILLILLMVGSASLSTLLTVHKSQVESTDVITGFLQMVAALLTMGTVNTFVQAERHAFRTGLLVAGCVTVLLAILPYWVPGFPDILKSYSSTQGSFAMGTLPDPNRFGVAMGICLFVAVSGNIDGKRLWLYCLWGALFAIGIIYSGSRGAAVNAMIALMCTCMWFIVYQMSTRRIKTLLWGSGVLLIVIAGGLGLLYKSRGINTADLVNHLHIINKWESKHIASDPRVLKSLIGWELYIQRPVLGWGVEGYTANSRFGSSHNSYIEIAVNFGGVGLLLFVIMLIRILAPRDILSKLRTKDQSEALYAAGRYGLTIFILLSLIVVNLQFVSFVYGVLGLLGAEANGGHTRRYPERGVGKLSRRTWRRELQNAQ